MKRYLFINKSISILYTISIIINELLAVVTALILQFIIDSVMSPTTEILSKIIMYAISFIILYFLGYIFARIVRAIYIKKLFSKIKNDMFKALLSHSIEEFNQECVATYLSKFNNDILKIEEQYFNCIFDYFGGIILFIASFISMLLINIPIAITVALLTIISIFIPIAFSHILAESEKEYLLSLERFNGRIKDFFTGFEVIKIFRMESKIKKLFIKSNADVEDFKYSYNINKSLADTVGNVFAIFMQFSIFVLAGFFVIKGRITIGAVVAITQLSGNIAMSILRIIENANELNSVSIINDDIIKIIEKSSKENNMKPNSISNSLFIEVKNLSFGYEQDSLVIKDISFKFEQGKKYAIVGTRGSGKSTLMKLLLSYYDNYSGYIGVGDTDYKNITAKDLYKIISVVHQNVILFDDTLLNNITLYREISEDKVKEVMRMVGLCDIVDRIQERIGDGGVNLSGGERQRIAIARALLNCASFLFIDEGTANLDDKVSKEIEDVIFDQEDITQIVITHKMNRRQLERYDTIIVLKNGCIVEYGNFEKLYNNNNEFYSIFTINQ